MLNENGTTTESHEDRPSAFLILSVAEADILRESRSWRS
jgi:hypothetical protein